MKLGQQEKEMAPDERKRLAIRVDVLKEIGTPLKYFALAILIVEALLAVLASKAVGGDFTFLVIGMILALLLLISIVGYLVAKRPEALVGIGQQQIPKVSLKDDVFISSPMAAFDNDDEYKRDR
jgi:hypothetical protein